MLSGHQSNGDKTESFPVEEIFIPFVPPKVKIEDLTSDCTLLDEKQITQVYAFVREQLKQKKFSSSLHFPLSIEKETFTHRFKKTELSIPYDVIVHARSVEDFDCYIVYRGSKTNSLLGSGGFGYAKVTENLKNEEFSVLKIVPGKATKEFEILQSVGQGLVYFTRDIQDPLADLNKYFIVRQFIARNSALTTQANIITKFAPGMMLATLLGEPYDDLPIEKWIDIFIQVLEAYRIFLDKKIVHCDLTLKNIFYDFITNKATIIDTGLSKKKSLFGIAKGDLAGTNGYLAPELTKNPKYTIRTDIYALGATFYYLLRFDKAGNSVRIKNQLICKQLYNFCFSLMLNANADERPSFEHVVNFFKTIKASLFNIIPEPFKKNGLFMIEEYLHLKQESEEKEIVKEEIKSLSNLVKDTHENENISFISWFFNKIAMILRKNPQINEVENTKEEESTSSKEYEIKPNSYENFIAILKMFDGVSFVDTKKRTKKEYLIICRELEQIGVQVTHKLFLMKDIPQSELLNALTYKINPEKLHTTHKYFYVTTDSTLQTIEKQNEESVYLMMIKEDMDLTEYKKTVDEKTSSTVLEKYIEIITALTSLQNKYSKEDPRYLAIQDILKTFKDKFEKMELTQSYLNEQFDTLKQQLLQLEMLANTDKTHDSHNLHKLRLLANRKKHHSELENKSETYKTVDAVQKNMNEWVLSYVTHRR